MVVSTKLSSEIHHARLECPAKDSSSRFGHIIQWTHLRLRTLSRPQTRRTTDGHSALVPDGRDRVPTSNGIKV